MKAQRIVVGQGSAQTMPCCLSSSRRGLRNLAFCLVFLPLAFGRTAAQDDIAGQTSEVQQDTTLSSPTTPAGGPPADDVRNADIPPEAPSVLLISAAVSESGETQPGSTPGSSSSLYSQSRFSGSANLLKFWGRSVTGVDYIGGGIFGGLYTQQIQQLTVGQRFLWTTRQLTLTDSLGTYPGGTFGASAFGGSSIYNLIFAGTDVLSPTTPDLYLLSGLNTISGIGQGSHLTNVTQAEFNQVLSPRSSVTFAAAYGFTDYSGAPNLINSRQIALLANYSYQLSPRSSVGILYGYQDFRFPETTQGKLHANQLLVLFQRQMSKRLTLGGGAGPEFADLTQLVEFKFFNPPLFITLKTSQVNLTAYGLAQYRLKKSSMAVSYHRLVSNGSGFTTGTNSDIVQGTINRGIARAWRGNVDVGYARLKELASSSVGSLPGSFQYWYAGAGIQRPLADHFGIFASYQANFENLRGSFCGGGSVCSGLWNIFSIGLSWYASPIRLGRGSDENGSKDTTSDQPGTDDLQQPPLQWWR